MKNHKLNKTKAEGVGMDTSASESSYSLKNTLRSLSILERKL